METGGDCVGEFQEGCVWIHSAGHVLLAIRTPIGRRRRIDFGCRKEKGDGSGALTPREHELLLLDSGRCLEHQENAKLG